MVIGLCTGNRIDLLLCQKQFLGGQTVQILPGKIPGTAVRKNIVVVSLKTICIGVAGRNNRTLCTAPSRRLSSKAQPPAHNSSAASRITATNFSYCFLLTKKHRPETVPYLL